MSKNPTESPIDLDQIRELIDLLIEKDVSEFAIERDGVKVKICRGTAEVRVAAAPVQHVVAAPAGVPAVAESGDAESTEYDDCQIVTSPMVGTFYVAADPESEPFTELGAHVSEGQTLCIIEAMKLMNEIVAEGGGEVAAVFVANGEPVEYGQRLFAIRGGA